MAGVEILYNGVCPVCRAGACDLERRAAAARAGVTFTEVSERREALTRAGVSLNAVRLRLHAIRSDGRVVRGMKACALAWAATPRYRALGRTFQVWPLSWIGALGYNLSAYGLWAWNRACGRW